MVIEAHGHSQVNWFGDVCFSSLQGAFNKEGAEIWAQQLQRSWLQQGQPERWAHLVDMDGWLGRTPESTELMRDALAWAEDHGLCCSVLVMAKGAANIFMKINQTTHSVIRDDADITICETHRQAIQLLHQRGFVISLLQLRHTPHPHPTSNQEPLPNTR
jgi:hypothetical protein